MFQRTLRMHFWQTWRCFSARKQFFFVWKSESDKQNSTTFLQEIFNSKNASGHAECSSDNPVKKLSDKSENFPLNVGTRKCKVFIGKFFGSTCSHVHLESSFWQPCRRVCHKMPMVFCPTSENFKHFFFKMLLWKRRRQFWQPRQKIFDKKPKTIRSRSNKYITKAFFKK